MSSRIQTLVAVVSVVILMAERHFCRAAAAGPSSACSTSASSLTVCLPAIQGDNPSFPTGACCAIVHSTDTGCLCTIATQYSGAISYMGINVPAALLLPKSCKHILPVGYNCDGYVFASGVPQHRKLMKV